MFWLSLAALASQALPASASTSLLPVKLETRSSLSSGLANVHISFNNLIDGVITYSYGRCDNTRLSEAHHTLGQSSNTKESRLVWVLPKDAKFDGCISAWDQRGHLIGRSEPQRLSRRKLKRRGANSIEMTNATGIDAWGPWFDGVELLKNKEICAVDVEKAKSKEVAIVGAGMSGLMTYLVLHQAGFTNLSIIEASQRLGGRVHTEYLSGGPFDYSYQEMGPMRFPESIEYSNVTYNITDHQMVFQLASEMNTLNSYDKNFSVDFIPWIQSNPNGLYYHNGIKLDTGLPPTVAQTQANKSLIISYPMDSSTKALSDKIDTITSNETLMVELATNTFKAHRDFLVNGLGGLGGDTWSEFAYMVNYLNATLNDTNMLQGDATSFWNAIYDNVYFGATKWKTIDGGLSRLPQSFHPLVDNVTTMNRKIERVEWLGDAQRVNLQWRDNYTDTVFQNASYDYAVFAVPFTMVKKMRVPYLPATISNAIEDMPYESACKVALEYKTRFWEHYANPIFGGCSTSTDIPGIGSICYPSYCLNCTGPATILASYASGDWGARWVSVPEEEHVQYMVDAMAEIHGQVAYEQYTGKYNRRCWMLDPYEGGSWASPTIGQHQLYLPEYFKTYNNMIFVGEQTSYTHAWIASALESGIRGGVQLLLELGLVDEAKATVEKWMARWIDVVSTLLPSVAFSWKLM
ncbi:flavin-containing amine oxidoreductase-domain containing protein [Daldinia caldariorum]|uniref:flavin-containing amine oxidoreductase-domain containing protein n=1 Tax=Daldinia caldariorum TaxID=326644 RepID=UPI002008B55B|nr:flavin-containing amine oxidoreductase-domain containing protein [Daldinia caldariorum]KAI1463958.1 flavin-containing amine oxidoreductase-domain containing protein [Daldinia caldariorum]